MRFLTGLLLVLLHLQPYLQPSNANSPRPVILPKDGCNCDRTYIRPVCSNSSYTYGNECQLRCESKARLKRGESPIVVSATGVCPREGCICPAGVVPVCGTDGNTYENECRLNCNSEKQVRLGFDPIYVKIREKCPNPCTCPIDIIPSCGSDGVTYSSHCLIECKNVRRKRLGLPPILRSPGACPDADCVCTTIVRPVCGTDGQTYPNECQLTCESNKQQRFGFPAIKVKSQGQCPNKQCYCPAYILAVCGSDGQTYRNECELKCASEKQQSNGGPPIFMAYKDPCNPPACQCPSIISPVCGSDNKSYRNICYLDCANQINVNNYFPSIYLKSYGVCTHESCICPAIWDPVCSSNGYIYANECGLSCTNRRRFSVGVPPLTVLYKGECRDCVCSKTYQPVCGSDGKTYGNSCELDCENDRRKQAGLPLLTWTKGECGCICPQVYRPVCASDFKTYGNKCVLGCENQTRAHSGLAPLTVSWEGECGCSCTDINLPVCGTDRRTYRNVCYLNCASFINLRYGWPAVYLRKNGSC